MRILVTGSAGMLGRAVTSALAGAHTVAGVDLPDGDLTVPADVDRLLALHRPEWVVHTAAYTDVDRAETDRDRAWAVNADATALLAERCARAGCGLTYISTDYVFDGEDPAGYAEDAPRRPLGWYGRSKAAGEEAVEKLATPWQIVRTSWLFGPGPRNFVLTIRRLLRERERLRVVDDQRGRPTYAPDLAAVLARLVDARATGVFHATNAGECTWFAFAQEIARREGHDPARVAPCTSDEYPTPARRPRCSILHSRRLEAVGVPPRPPWQDALGRYLEWLRRQERARPEEER